MKGLTIQIRKQKTESILRKHPWIFSGAIAEIIGDAEDGTLVEVRDNFDNFLARGHYQKGSIAVRILSFDS